MPLKGIITCNGGQTECCLPTGAFTTGITEFVLDGRNRTSFCNIYAPTISNGTFKILIIFNGLLS